MKEEKMDFNKEGIWACYEPKPGQVRYRLDMAFYINAHDKVEVDTIAREIMATVRYGGGSSWSATRIPRVKEAS